MRAVRYSVVNGVTVPLLFLRFQILIYLPEHLGRKWQYHSVGRLMSKLLHPGNSWKLLKREAMRLFLLWYQVWTGRGQKVFFFHVIGGRWLDERYGARIQDKNCQTTIMDAKCMQLSLQAFLERVVCAGSLIERERREKETYLTSGKNVLFFFYCSGSWRGSRGASSCPVRHPGAGFSQSLPGPGADRPRRNDARHTGLHR